MRPAEERLQVRDLAVEGLNYCQIARLTGIPRSTVRNWISPSYRTRDRSHLCDACGCIAHPFDALPQPEYSSLLGMYLGDGTIARVARSFALRVSMDSRYPNIIREV